MLAANELHMYTEPCNRSFLVEARRICFAHDQQFARIVAGETDVRAMTLEHDAMSEK